MNCRSALKYIARKTLLGSLVRALRSWKAIWLWQKQGRPVPPPPDYKQAVVRRYGKEFHLKTLVETGTYLGEMVAAQSHVFSQIYSIELDNDLYQKATKKFAKCSHITVLHGDSSQVLWQVLKKIDEPCLFWLDAHYSGGITARGSRDTPIIQELEIIFKRNNSGDVILIDDVHCFNGSNDYPTLDDLKTFLLTSQPHAALEVNDNILRFHRKSSGINPPRRLGGLSGRL